MSSTPESSSGENANKYWDFEVAILYRRLHKYPSYWNQNYKFACITNTPTHLSHQNWPGVLGDYKILSFEDWFLETTKYCLLRTGFLRQRNIMKFIHLVVIIMSGKNVQMISQYSISMT